MKLNSRGQKAPVTVTLIQKNSVIIYFIQLLLIKQFTVVQL